MHELDEFDKKILGILQQNNRLAAEELGEMIGLSASAVQRRLKKLREEGVIVADVSLLSHSAVGIGITCIVDVVLHLGNSENIETFKTAMNQCREVMQCYYVTGTYDFVIIVNLRDMEEFEQFSRLHLMDHPNVKHFYTHVVMDRVKKGHAIRV